MDNVKRYYVRKPGTNDFRGTFTLNEIRGQIRSGFITTGWEAIVATGQTFGQLQRSSSWLPLRVVIEDSSSPPPRRDASKPPPRQDNTTPVASFACVACGITVRFPLREAHYRCPKCKSEYKIVGVSNAPLAFLLIPERVASSRTSGTPKTPRSINPQVRAAFALFGLEETVTLERIRLAYREAVSLYHPDKVAHLGAELKQLAEEKTKRFNSAFSILEAFYDT